LQYPTAICLFSLEVYIKYNDLNNLVQIILRMDDIRTSNLNCPETHIYINFKTKQGMFVTAWDH